MYNERLGNCCQYCRQIGFLRPNSSRHFSPNHLVGVAPRAGFEPATNRLTAGCSTTELPGNKPVLRRRGYNKARRLCKGRGSANSVVCPPPPRHGRNLREPRLACQPKRRRREGWRPRPELNRGTQICSFAARFVFIELIRFMSRLYRVHAHSTPTALESSARSSPRGN